GNESPPAGCGTGGGWRRTASFGLIWFQGVGEAIDSRLESIEHQLEPIEFGEAGFGFVVADQSTRLFVQVVGQVLAQAVGAASGPGGRAAQAGAEQLGSDRAKPARNLVFPVQ